MHIHKTRFAAAAVAATCLAGPAVAHHSFAMFDLAQQKLIEGEVTAWNYNNPHSWLIVNALDAKGEMQTWSFEGAAIVHAARQGVNGTTYRKGEKVRIVMSPIRDGRNAGALCFVIKEDGSFTRPNDGICDADAMIARWQSKGWLEHASHLDAHPTAD
jgi:Family of unknown function (DUF6152)